VPGAMSVPTLYVPLASMVVFGAGAGAGAGSAWAIPTAAQKPATVNAAATADAFVDLITVQFSRPNHSAGIPGPWLRHPSKLDTRIGAVARATKSSRPPPMARHDQW
jgi:hypothetical protein